MALQIQSSARISSKQVILGVFGEQNSGKTMLIPTAPAPLWLLTEPTRAESLTEENIALVYGKKPTAEDIAAMFRSENPSAKKAEVDAAVSEALADIPGFTGITYDVQMIDCSSYEKLTETVQFLKSPDAAAYKTVFLDSASAANLLVQNHELNKKTKAGNNVHGQLASKIAQDWTYKWFSDMIQIPKDIVFLFQAEDKTDEEGSGESMILHRNIAPALYGRKLKREFKHLFSHIFQVINAGKDDNGVSQRMLRTRATTQYGVERTLCPRLSDLEPTNLTNLFAKMKGNAPTK